MLKFRFIQTVCLPADILIQRLSNISHKIYSLALRAGPYLIPHHHYQSLQLRLIQDVEKTKLCFSIVSHAILSTMFYSYWQELLRTKGHFEVVWALHSGKCLWTWLRGWSCGY